MIESFHVWKLRGSILLRLGNVLELMSWFQST